MLRFPWVVLFLVLLLSACSHSPVTTPEIKGVFSDEDIDNASLSVATQVDEVSGVQAPEVSGISEGNALPNSHADSGDFTPQAVLPNTSGFVYYIRHDPALTNPWRIQRVNQTNNALSTLYAGNREIQAVGGSSDGNTIIFSMRETTSSTSDFEIYRIIVSPRTVQRLTNNAVQDTNVSLSADASILTWQAPVSGVSSILFRVYAGSTFSQSRLAYPTPAREPSISGNGRFITFVHDRPNGLDQLWKYSLVNNTYTAIYSTPSTSAILTHPSITDNGNRLMFLIKYPNNQDIQFIDLITNQRRSAVYSTRTLEHPFITADGKYLTYGYSAQLPSNPPTDMTVYVKEITSGALAPVRFAGINVRQFGMSWQQTGVPIIPGQPFLLQDTFAPTDLSSQAQGILFGLSLDLSGTTAVVGAPFDIYDANANGTVECSSSDFDGVGSECKLGSVYVLERNPQGRWIQSKKLRTPGIAFTNSQFGIRVVIDGNTLAVAYNSNNAAIYERNLGGANNWGLSKVIFSNGSNLSLDKDTLIVGSTLFERNLGGPNNWGEVKMLPQSISKTAIYEDTLVAGNPSQALDANNDGIIDCDSVFGTECRVGVAYIYKRNQGGANNWGQIQTLVASDASGRDEFGVDVDINGTTIVVRSSRDESREDVLLPNYAYVFELGATTNTWRETQKLVPPIGYSFFTSASNSVSIANNGNTIALLASVATSEDPIIIYDRNPNTGIWSRTTIVINNDDFCNTQSLKLENGILATGNIYCQNSNSVATGATYFYSR